MENRIYDIKNGPWYERQGDYYIPCFRLTEEEEQTIGIWGQRHKRHLQEYRKGMYTELLLAGKLNRYLADVDRQAWEMYERLVTELAKKEDIMERLKAHNQMAWVGRMNNIAARAREIVNNEIIFA